MEYLYEEGHVYFIGEVVQEKDEDWVYHKPSIDFVKIGWSAVDPKTRLSSLQTGNPRELILIYAIKTQREGEGKIHSFLDFARERGEWFRFKDIFSYLTMWMPISNYYDIDKNVLNIERYKVKIRGEDRLIPMPFHVEKSDIDKMLNYTRNEMICNTVLKPTTAKKMYFDTINNIIRPNDEYFRIETRHGWGSETKVALPTLCLMIKLAKEFKLFDKVEEMNEFWAKKSRAITKMQEEEFEKFFPNLFEDTKLESNARNL